MDRRIFLKSALTISTIPIFSNWNQMHKYLLSEPMLNQSERSINAIEYSKKILALPPEERKKLIENHLRLFSKTEIGYVNIIKNQIAENSTALNHQIRYQNLSNEVLREACKRRYMSKFTDDYQYGMPILNMLNPGVGVYDWLFGLIESEYNESERIYNFCLGAIEYISSDEEYGKFILENKLSPYLIDIQWTEKPKIEKSKIPLYRAPQSGVVEPTNLKSSNELDRIVDRLGSENKSEFEKILSNQDPKMMMMQFQLFNEERKAEARLVCNVLSFLGDDKMATLANSLYKLDSSFIERKYQSAVLNLASKHDGSSINKESSILYTNSLDILSNSLDVLAAVKLFTADKKLNVFDFLNQILDELRQIQLTQELIINKIDQVILATNNIKKGLNFNLESLKNGQATTNRFINESSNDELFKDVRVSINRINKFKAQQNLTDSNLEIVMTEISNIYNFAFLTSCSHTYTYHGINELKEADLISAFENNKLAYPLTGVLTKRQNKNSLPNLKIYYDGVDLIIRILFDFSAFGIQKHSSSFVKELANDLILLKKKYVELFSSKEIIKALEKVQLNNSNSFFIDSLKEYNQNNKKYFELISSGLSSLRGEINVYDDLGNVLKHKPSKISGQPNFLAYQTYELINGEPHMCYYHQDINKSMIDQCLFYGFALKGSEKTFEGFTRYWVNFNDPRLKNFKILFYRYNGFFAGRVFYVYNFDLTKTRSSSSKWVTNSNSLLWDWRTQLENILISNGSTVEQFIEPYVKSPLYKNSDKKLSLQNINFIDFFEIVIYEGVAGWIGEFKSSFHEHLRLRSGYIEYNNLVYSANIYAYLVYYFNQTLMNESDLPSMVSKDLLVDNFFFLLSPADFVEYIQKELNSLPLSDAIVLSSNLQNTNAKLKDNILIEYLLLKLENKTHSDLNVMLKNAKSFDSCTLPYLYELENKINFLQSIVT